MQCGGRGRERGRRIEGSTYKGKFLNSVIILSCIFDVKMVLSVWVWHVCLCHIKVFQDSDNDKSLEESPHCTLTGFVLSVHY